MADSATGAAVSASSAGETNGTAAVFVETSEGVENQPLEAEAAAGAAAAGATAGAANELE